MILYALGVGAGAENPTGEALRHARCGSEPKFFGSMDARFSKPVWPGATLTVKIWDLDDGAVAFQTEKERRRRHSPRQLHPGEVALISRSSP